MKTLYLSHAAALGGAELYLLDYLTYCRLKHQNQGSKTLLFAEGNFAESLRGVGAEVEVLAAPKRLLGVTREAKGYKSLGVASELLGLARKVARAALDYDVIFANSQKAFTVGALAALSARKPLIWCLHDILTAEHFSAANRKLVIALAKLTGALVVANSQATADAFVAAGGQKSKVRVVYNGIDVDAYCRDVTAHDIATHDVTADLRRDPGVAGIDLSIGLGTGNAPVVGVFSRLSEWKGQHVLLDALTQLPGVHAVLVGDALFGEDAYAERLREQTRRLGLGDRVHFLGFRRDIPELMQRVDIVAHTSVTAEPFGRVVVEGMLSEKPVIATRAGAIPEIISDGETGLMVEPGDADALAAAISATLAAPERAAALGKAARRAAQGRFSLAALSEGLERCFAELGVAGTFLGAPDTLDEYELRVA